MSLSPRFGHDTGQPKTRFNRCQCQLIITWMSNIREVHSKPRLHVSVNLHCIIWSMAAMLRDHRRHHPHAYTPMSNTTNHDNHEKINSWVSFSFPYDYGAPLGFRAARAPLLTLSYLVITVWWPINAIEKIPSERINF